MRETRRPVELRSNLREFPTSVRELIREVGDSLFDGGGGEIRTHETLSSLPVFKTGAFNRSATPPGKDDAERVTSVPSHHCSASGPHEKSSVDSLWIKTKAPANFSASASN